MTIENPVGYNMHPEIVENAGPMGLVISMAGHRETRYPLK